MLPFKERFNDILISSVVLSIHLAKVCIYENLHYVGLKLFLGVYTCMYIYVSRSVGKRL